jgi:hypothetical protein
VEQDLAGELLGGFGAGDAQQEGPDADQVVVAVDGLSPGVSARPRVALDVQSEPRMSSAETF